MDSTDETVVRRRRWWMAALAAAVGVAASVGAWYALARDTAGKSR